MIEIFQGEPLNFTITVKDDNGTYLTDLSSLSLEAIVKDFSDNSVKGWSSSKGTITYSQKVISGVTIGCATFSLLGKNTSNLEGKYSAEVAKIVTEGRAIGITKAIFNVLPAQIKNGVSCNIF